MKLTMSDSGSQGKVRLAWIVIGLSLAGLLLGIASRTPLFDTFSLGGWLGFITFLLSLGTVEDSGSNAHAKLAFWVSFVSMALSIFLSATA